MLHAAFPVPGRTATTAPGDLPCASDAASMRGTLRAFFRGERSAVPAAAPPDPMPTLPEPEPEDSWTPPPHPERAAAHAAFRAVVGGGPRAVDAALAVAEARARDLRLRCLAQEEALKLLHLYASDDWAHSVAARALERPVCRADLPAYLHDPSLADAQSCRCGVHR